MSSLRQRLHFRRPAWQDAAAIFERYASDPEVTRYVGWPRHETLDDTYAFLEFSEQEWKTWPGGPLLIEDHQGQLLGATGLSFDLAGVASTGYVLAQDAWGQGFATEALSAMVGLANALGVTRLYALVHSEHAASRRVLAKGGFQHEISLEWRFPNLGSGGVGPAERYVWRP